MSDAAATSPEAYYDTLIIVTSTPPSVAPLSSQEVHLFGYLACTLALLKGRPVADWGYKFALTSEGRPYSYEIDRALWAMVTSGAVVRDDGNGLLEVRQAVAQRQLDLYGGLAMLGERQEWSRVAIECALALPVGTIRRAMLSQPGVAQAVELLRRRELMRDDDVTRIHADSARIRELVGVTDDLLAPAIAWLALRLDGPEALC